MKCEHESLTADISSSFRHYCRDCGKVFELVPIEPKEPEGKPELCSCSGSSRCWKHLQEINEQSSTEKKEGMVCEGCYCDPSVPSACSCKCHAQHQPKPKLECRCQNGNPHESNIIELGNNGYLCPCECHGEKVRTGKDAVTDTPQPPNEERKSMTPEMKKYFAELMDDLERAIEVDKALKNLRKAASDLL